jgi:hypothetical protein
VTHPWAEGDCPRVTDAHSGAFKTNPGILVALPLAVEFQLNLLNHSVDTHPEATEAHTGALKAHPGVLNDHPGLLKAHSLPLKAHPGFLNDRPGLLKAHSGPFKANPGVLKARPGATGIPHRHADVYSRDIH